MRCLVTGATGFIGSRLVELLLGQGHEVRCLVRPGPRTARLAALGAELAWGDIRNLESVRAACRGRQWVFHNAALIYHYSPRVLLRTNCQGMLNLLRGCVAAGTVQRLVYSSSVAAMGPCPALPADEDQPLAPLAYDAYGRSKRRAEESCRRFAERYGLPVTVIRMAGVYGPHSPLFTNGLRFLRHGLFILLGPGTSLCHFSHVDDVCSALILAAAAPRAAGRTYIIVDDRPVSIRQVAARAAELLGSKPRFASVPVGAARSAIRLVEAACRLTSLNLPVNRTMVDYLGSDHYYSADRAKRELGWQPRFPDPLAGLADMVNWYRRRTDS